MVPVDQIRAILMNNHNMRKLKTDEGAKTSCIRVINLFVSYGLYNLNENGTIQGKISKRLDDLTNFELLHIIETVLCSNDSLLMDPFLAKSIQSIDSLGKCWYYPKELSLLIFEQTGNRHNYKKIKVYLNQLVKEGICLKVTNMKRQSMYRILFTYSEE